jgi:hypothetical protein
LCVSQNIQPRNLSVQQLQDKLLGSGAILETPGETIKNQ